MSAQDLFGFADDVGSDEPVVLCPVCGFYYTHIKSAGTLFGSDAREARVYPGTERVGDTGERRSALRVVFNCENFHRFALVIQQRKGINYVTTERLPDMPGDDDPGSY